MSALEVSPFHRIALYKSTFTSLDLRVRVSSITDLSNKIETISCNVFPVFWL